MNYQDIIQIVYIALLLEMFLILAYVISILVDIKSISESTKLVVSKFKDVSDKTLDIADDIQIKIQKIISFTDILGEIPDMVKKIFFNKHSEPDDEISSFIKKEKSPQKESGVSRDARPNIIRKRII